MKVELHKAETRGHFNYGWLDTNHTFSFARYYEPDRVNFGALRVLNDDIVQAGKGFGRHPHDNMEIISIPLEGKLLHRDSMGHEQILKTGEVQVMSAGTGIFHEEFNGSENNPVNFLQIWIIPNKNNIEPTYNQKEFNADDALNKWQLLVGPDNGNGDLKIQQNAYVSRTFLNEGASIEYITNHKENGNYIFLIKGKVQLNNLELNSRDGIGISESENIAIKALEDSYLINIEVPLNMN